MLVAKLYVRDIDEIHRRRSTNYRNTYEDTTRKIRFSFYEYFKCPIILGHNKDDCIENILSNLSKQIHFDNLFGMKTITYDLNNVKIIRPMLEITKNSIIQYADHNNIPHLEDSTPCWSRRGQMRDTLIPSINAFDPKIIDGIYNFAIHSMKLSQQWYSWFDSWRNDNIVIEREENKITVNINIDKFFNLNYENIDFWVHIWFKMELQTRPTNKSFRNMIRCITDNEKNNTVTLNKYFNAIITPNHISLKMN
jgi:tRNA(Ile)-lysidine synthase TilS/MesJ